MKKDSINKRVFRNGNYYDSMAWLSLSYDDYKEWCEEMEEEIHPEHSEKYWDQCRRIFENDWDDFKCNMKYSKWNVPCMITGSLGLWNGRPNIAPVYCKTLIDAIAKCSDRCDDAEVNLKDGYIEVLGKHHDGTNCFEIHILSKKGLREVERPKYYYEDYDIKPWWFKNIYGYLF